MKDLMILSNILVCAGGNKLRLCDLSFDSKIRKIHPKSERLFDWDELKEKPLKDLLLREFSNDETSDQFLLAMPGAIDPHVHFDTPGFEFRDDFEHGTAAALTGGVTTVIDMPCTSLPTVVSLANMEIKLKVLNGRSYADYAFWGGVSGNEFNESTVRKNIKDLTASGVAGFKTYLTSGMESFRDLTIEQMKLTALLVADTGKPLAVHAEDKELVSQREKHLKNTGRNDWQAYCESRDTEAEAAAVENLVRIAYETKCKIHIVHLSSKRALDLIRTAQNEGVSITTETCPHYLHFTQSDFENESIRNYLKTAPPVKFSEDKEALWGGLKSGAILFVTTDHAGCDPGKEKTDSNFWNVYGGIPSVEHRVPYLFSEGFLKGKLTLEQTINLLSTNAAVYFGLRGKGRLREGFDADVALIDLWNGETIHADQMHSKGKYTPFENYFAAASIGKVFLRGELVRDTRGINVGKLTGEFIKI